MNRKYYLSLPLVGAVVTIVAFSIVGWPGGGSVPNRCNRPHAIPPRSVMDDAEWKCIRTGTPLWVMRRLYGVTPTKDTSLLLWNSAGNRIVYSASFGCNDDAYDSATCPTSNWVLKQKKEYVK